MRGSRSHWLVAVATVVLAVPVATAQGHPADWMYSGVETKQIGNSPGGISTFMQRQAAALPGSFTLVGHDPLAGPGTTVPRGMNAAIAVHKNYVYVGSRTDGKPSTPHSGVLIVDVKDPAHPFVAREMGPPLEGNPRESSRELRVWRSQNVLIVQHTNCGTGQTHLCQGNTPSVRFYDISGENATNPQLLFQNNRDTHEFFIWEDPKNPKRALMFNSSATQRLQILDISPVLNKQAPILLADVAHGFGNSTGSGVHSFSVSNDGTRLYNALLTRGFGISDVSDFTDTDPSTNTYSLITPQANRVQWPGPGAHSAVKLWNKDWVYVSDEVYGTITAAGHGCPWGWTRFIDIADPTRPVVRSDFRLPENQPAVCDTFNPPRTSYSAHNPTLTPSIAFSTWHSGGFQAMDVTNPMNVTQLAEFKPEPEATVVTEDPRLSADDPALYERKDVKVVMWSYPVIQDGLIYVVDIRNGLYILKYNGPHEQEANDVGFLEGNSNQGDAQCYEPVAGSTTAYCETQTPGGAGGTVPATLSLTVGGPATFGPFTPGVARDYNASTTANVISSAGDAALSVADASATNTGHLVNGSFFLPSKVQARARNTANPNTAFADVGSSAAPTPLLTWGGPISNDGVTLDFKQPIGANDALRTGSYSKILTFTLSTTTP